MGRFGFGRATKLVAVMALIGAPTFALLSQSPAGAVTPVTTVSAFRTAFANDSSILLGADINLDSCGGGDAYRNSSTAVTIDGAGHKITQSNDCDNRVLTNDGSGTLTLLNVTVTGGTESNDGGNVYSQGSVVLDGASVDHGHATDCNGGGIYVSDGDLTLTNASSVHDNTADCTGGGVYVDNGSLTVEKASSINNNQAAESNGGFAVYGEVTITDSTISGNSALNGEGGGGENKSGIGHNNPITITKSTVSDNHAYGDGGGIESEGNTTITSSSIVNNHAGDDGGGINVDDNHKSVNTITDSTLSGNVAGDDGGAIRIDNGSALTVTGSTLANNASANGDGGAIKIAEDNLALVVTNSTVTGNSQPYEGAIAYQGYEGGSVSFVYDTITNNTVTVADASQATGEQATEPQDAPEVRSQFISSEPASLSVGSQRPFTAFATVIVQPHGGPNCDVGSADTSGEVGYNYSDDTTCDFHLGTDSQLTTNDALLGALADNTGPTMTQLPQPGSPLIDAIKTSACGNGDSAAGFSVTDDQRHVTRPQIKGCDIGAVEVRGATLSVTKVVTGTAGSPVPSAGYSFKVTCTDGTTGTLTVADATAGGTSPTTIADILPGSTCSVAEAAVVFTTAISGQPAVTYDPANPGPGLAEGAAETVTVTNDYSLVKLSPEVVVIQPKFTG